MTGKMLIYATPLTPEDCIEWSSMACWSYHEAVLLSMGLNPKHASHEIEKDEAEKYGIEHQKRWDIFDRSQHAPNEEDRFPALLIPSRHEFGACQEVACRPGPFTKWAMKQFFSFPNELCKAVKERYPEEFLEAPTKKIERNLRPDQIARERCRAIAEMLWDSDQSIKTKEMVERPELKKYGYPHGTWAPKAVYGWIADLAPKNRSKDEKVENFEK